MAGLMAIGPVNAPAEPISEMAKRKRVACVQLHLKVRLAPIGSERPLSDDEPHNVPDVEFAHSLSVTRCSALEQSHVARVLAFLQNEPRGT